MENTSARLHFQHWQDLMSSESGSSLLESESHLGKMTKKQVRLETKRGREREKEREWDDDDDDDGDDN